MAQVNNYKRACVRNKPPVYLFDQSNGTRGHRNLPLNLIGLIISFLEDVGDIARVTRASRLLYYMTLPRLYESVILRSYDSIRYKNGRPQGYGSGSPFSMGLNGLLTGSTAAYVRSFTLTGEWKEPQIEEFSRGRVPDKTMLLSIAVRAAIDKMVGLQAFSWDLNLKPLKTVFEGLAARPTLISMSLKFQTERIPCPSICIPPMPNLRVLKLWNIDPLYYPDDVSVLIASARNLESLSMEYNPRIRDQGQASINLHTYFGKAAAAPYFLPVKRISVKSGYAQTNEIIGEAFDLNVLEEFTLLNCIDSGHPVTVFLDETWKATATSHFPSNLKMLRINSNDPSYVAFLHLTHGLQKLYIVNARTECSLPTPESMEVVSDSAFHTPVSMPNGSDAFGSGSGAEYLSMIVNNHGMSLRHVLLSDEWLVGKSDLLPFVTGCPNIEQLGIAFENQDGSLFELMLPYLPKLFAARLLGSPTLRSSTELQGDGDDEALLEKVDTFIRGHANLQWIGWGTTVFGRYASRTYGEEDMDLGLPSRLMTKVFPSDAAKDVDIWRMDSLDLF